VRPYLGKNLHKKGLVEWLKVRPQVQVLVLKKKKKKSFIYRFHNLGLTYFEKYV
jgi:hypothetical protein